MGLFRNNRILIQDKQAMANMGTSSREECYFVEKEEFGRGCCCTGKSFGENQEFRVMMVLIGRVAGVVDFLQEIQYVHPSL